MATHTVVEAVAITAAISLSIAGILFYFLYRFVITRRLKKNKPESSFRREVMNGTPRIEFRRHGGAVKGVIVDEEGLDVLYLRKLEDGHVTSCFSKVWHNPIGEEVKRMNSRAEPNMTEPIQEIPLLREPSFAYKSSASKKPVGVVPNSLHKQSELAASKMPSEYIDPPQTPSPPPPRVRPSPPSPPPTPLHQKGSLVNQNLLPPPPPPPPPPPLPKRGNLKPAPGPPKLKPAPPPIPAKTKGLFSPQKPPIAPRGSSSRHRTVEAISTESLKDNGAVQKKLKPLHWDKVTANADHSMVWNEINDGSFRFDDDLMEALFGYTTTSQRLTERNNKSFSQGGSSSIQSAQIVLLDPRKSQNTAIVLKSLAVSLKEILDALLEGRGLNADTLEKLTKICPTQDVITKILQFSGNPTKLADAESFLYHILKAVPSAFIRFNAMLFRATYDTEILVLKESLQTLELGCKELRAGGIFFKLLEAILKAGNKMNAGTARGNAQGFNLSALLRLSDVKSTNGKTTLLHFVVEQVIRSEGKRRLINQNPDPGGTSKNSGHKNSNEETEREYLMLGLSIVGGLSSEFANVKKAAAIDHDHFNGMCSILSNRVNEIKQLLMQCRDEPGRFLTEMKGFLEDCEEELHVVRDEETRVMELVRKTTVYYQAGVSKERSKNLLQLFIIVKDFLNMVDQVCTEITKKLQKTKVASAGSSPPLSPTPRSPVRFQNLQTYFMTQRPGTNSSESEDDFC